MTLVLTPPPGYCRAVAGEGGRPGPCSFGPSGGSVTGIKWRQTGLQAASDFGRPDALTMDLKICAFRVCWEK